MCPELGPQHNVPRTRAPALFQKSAHSAKRGHENVPRMRDQAHNTDGVGVPGHHSGRRSASPNRPVVGLAERQIKFAEEVHFTKALDFTGANYFDLDPAAELNVAESVPEYIEVDVAVDSGAGNNVLSRVDAQGMKSRSHQDP